MTELSLRQQAENVAKAGRMGDSMLIHVNPMELQGIASLTPLTVNPDTGQTEAFLPFLLGALAPMIPGLTGALGGGMLGAGLAAGGGALAGSLVQGDEMEQAMKNALLMGLGGGLMSGIGGGLGEALSGAAKTGTAPAAIAKQAATEAGSLAAANAAAPAALAATPATAGASTMPGMMGLSAPGMANASLATAKMGVPAVPSMMSMAPNALETAPMAAGNIAGPSLAGATAPGIGLAGSPAGPLAGAKPGGIMNWIKNNPMKSAMIAGAGLPLIDSLTRSNKMPGAPKRNPPRRLTASRGYNPMAPDQMGYENNYFTDTTFSSYNRGGVVRYAGGGDVFGGTDGDFDGMGMGDYGGPMAGREGQYGGSDNSQYGGADDRNDSNWLDSRTADMLGSSAHWTNRGSYGGITSPQGGGSYDGGDNDDNGDMGGIDGSNYNDLPTSRALSGPAVGYNYSPMQAYMDRRSGVTPAVTPTSGIMGLRTPPMGPTLSRPLQLPQQASQTAFNAIPQTSMQAMPQHLDLSQYGRSSYQPRYPGLANMWNGMASIGDNFFGANVPRTWEMDRNRVLGYAEGGPVRGMGGHPIEQQAQFEPGIRDSDDRQIVMDVLLALRGQHDNPEVAVRAFIKRFGPKAFEDLMEKEMSGSISQSAADISSGRGGRVVAPEGGDMLPAENPDGSAAALGNNEFVLSENMVKQVGNGDVNAGIAALDNMRRQVELV